MIYVIHLATELTFFMKFKRKWKRLFHYKTTSSSSSNLLISNNNNSYRCYRLSCTYNSHRHNHKCNNNNNKETFFSHCRSLFHSSHNFLLQHLWELTFNNHRALARIFRTARALNLNKSQWQRHYQTQL